MLTFCCKNGLFVMNYCAHRRESAVVVGIKATGLEEAVKIGKSGFYFVCTESFAVRRSGAHKCIENESLLGIGLFDEIILACGKL